jgi:hypothetical protein
MVEPPCSRDVDGTSKKTTIKTQATSQFCGNTHDKQEVFVPLKVTADPAMKMCCSSWWER